MTKTLFTSPACCTKCDTILDNHDPAGNLCKSCAENWQQRLFEITARTTAKEVFAELCVWCTHAGEGRNAPTLRLVDARSGNAAPLEIEMHDANYSVEYMAEEIDDEGDGGDSNPNYTFGTLGELAAHVIGSQPVQKDGETFVAVLRSPYRVTADDKGDAICKFADEFSEHHDMGAIITMVPEREWEKTEQVREVAPELLAACRSVVTNRDCTNDGRCAKEPCSVCLCTAAIAKANGKN